MTERRTLGDRFAVRFPSAYRGVASVAWRLFSMLRPGHPARRALLESVVRRSYRAFNRNDFDALRPVYHPGCIWDWSHFEGWLTDPVTRGFDGMRRDWLTFREAWGECRFEADDIRDFGDKQMVTCHMRGTGTGSGVGLETTWWQVGYSRDGLIALVENYSDRREALEAVGLSE